MRTTLTSQTRESLFNLRAATERRNEATARLSSGLRVRKPSDAPADAAAAIRTRSFLAGIERYKENLNATRSELRAVDGALFEAETALERAAVLAAQGASDTQSAQNRQTIAEEVRGIFRHVLTISNTVYSGRYLFAGAADDVPPFVEDPASAAGVQYVGDGQNRELLFPDGRPAPVSLPGDSIFLLPTQFAGAGRTPATTPPAPNLPVGVGVAFEGDVGGLITADLTGPFVAAAPPAGALAGDVVTVSFTADDTSFSGAVSVTLAGGETAADIAGLLNAEIALDPSLDGAVSFADEGGALRLNISDTAGTGVSFTSTSVGGVTTGLEAGGVAGGFSAAEIAAALNAQIATKPDLLAAGVQFGAADGELTLDSDVAVTFTAVDFDRGTGFASGLAGVHSIGGRASGKVFGALDDLIGALEANDSEAIAAAAGSIQNALAHVSTSHAFYGTTIRQIDVSIDNLDTQATVNEERLSLLQDADILAAIADFQNAETAEQFAIQIASRRRPTILDEIV